MWIWLVWVAKIALFLLPLLLLTLFIFLRLRQRMKWAARVDLIPGPPVRLIFGNALDMMIHAEDLYKEFYDGLATFGPIIRLWMINKPLVAVTRARDVEPLLQGMTHHAKSENYRFLHDWMGLGLLTSRDEKWRIHRKVLTPTFHFNILHKFLPIFNKHALKMTQRLAVEPSIAAEKGFNIFPYSSLCGLDIICESSMGYKIDAQSNENSPYVKAIISLSELVIKRYFTPWLRFDFIFNLSASKRELDHSLNVSNTFIDQVISDRRKYQKTRGFSSLKDDLEDDAGGRPRLAFLDLLLAAEADGAQFMTQKDIRDQVSTFMFEGHDTVSTTTSWVLFMLGTYPDAQQRVVEELHEVFGESGRAPDMADLSHLKYLERCIKETLRLYPSVPFFERKIETDVQTEYHEIPAGCTVSINVYMLHRDPEYWPYPEEFNPDRFLPENVKGRHPYAYIPFSAGPRNCIGQKFALLEEKVVVSTVLRRFRVEAAHSRDEADLQMNLVLRPRNGLRIRLYDRNSHPKLRVSQ